MHETLKRFGRIFKNTNIYGYISMCDFEGCTRSEINVKNYHDDIKNTRYIKKSILYSTYYHDYL